MKSRGNEIMKNITMQLSHTIRNIVMGTLIAGIMTSCFLTLEGNYAKFRIKSITGTSEITYQSSGDSRFVQSYDKNCHELQLLSEIKRR